MTSLEEGTQMGATKLSYRLRVLSGARFSKLNEKLSYIHSISGRSKAWLLKDIIHCARKFGSGYNDYTTYHFWKLDDATRDTYITRFRSKALVTQMNDPEYVHFFDNKNEFDERFAEYEKRSFVDVESASDEEIREYFAGRDKTFAKMKDLSCGTGVEKLYMKDFRDADQFCAYVREKGFGVLEDVLENHPDLQEINPYCLNTVRMITLIGDDGKPYLFFAALKFGLEKRVVDVFGMHAPVDLETGICNYPFHSGETSLDRFYTEHPVTHKNVIGFKVPFWEEARELALRAAMEIPQVRYVGWDMAITPDGPAIIEGNNYSSYDYMQLPKQSDSTIGVIPDILKIVPSYKYK